MDLTGGFGARSGGGGPCREATGLESLHLSGDEFRQMATLPPENAGGFTALLELPPTQAVELLHFTDSSSSSQAVAVTGIGVDIASPLHSFGTLPFPSNSVLMERAARFSVTATEQQNGNVSGETTTSSVPSNSSANLDRVKTEPAETDSSQRLISDQAVENQSPCPSQNNRSGKRKDFDKKAKSSTKKNKSSEENEKLPYVHVRARRGQATDSHSLAERARREKINARMKLLQELVPGCDKIQGTALVLDEIINHVQSLQRQVEMLSMRLAAVNPRIDFNLDTILASENGSLMDGSFNDTAMQLAWPHQVIETEQSYHHRQLQQWPFDGLNQPTWGREEDQGHGNDHNSLMAVSENLMISNWSRCLDQMFDMNTRDSVEENDLIESEKSFSLLNELSDLLMLPKDMLMDLSIREEVCPSINFPLIKRILYNFTPDEFCPDHVPGAVLEKLNAESISEQKISGFSFPYSASPVTYIPPSSINVAEKIAEVGGDVSRISRNASVIQRKGYTSEDELEEMDYLLTFVIDKVSVSRHNGKVKQQDEQIGAVVTNARSELLR